MGSNGTLPNYTGPWSDGGDTFTFNLISDLGPVLSLLGEQVAKQFMGESLGWSDNILFAMAPLGIITAVIGAIRVGGPGWMKSLIGRARENRALAEMELMSSTSHEVCEMWNGVQIVRIPGSPATRELIHIKPERAKICRSPLARELGLRRRHTGTSSGAGTISGTAASTGTCSTTTALAMTQVDERDELPAMFYTLGDNEIREHLLKNGEEIKNPSEAVARSTNCAQKDVQQSAIPEVVVEVISDSRNGRLPREIPEMIVEVMDDSRKNSQQPEKKVEMVETINVFPVYGLENGKKSLPPGSRCTREGGNSTSSDSTYKSPDLDSNPAMAPCISLNAHDRSGRTEIRMFALLGTFLQSAVLVWDAYATYIRRYKKGSLTVASYAFPITCTGTIIMVIGMFICAYVIDRSTEENRYSPKEGLELHMLWLQKGGAVNDQVFEPYAIFANGRRSVITSSRRRDLVDQNPNNKKHRVESPYALAIWTTIGVLAGLLGFISQFIGLRAMHWSASLTQLSATLVLASMRAWVRRAKSTPPYAQKLPRNHELDWLATRASDPCSLARLWTSPHPKETESAFWSQACQDWGIRTGGTLRSYDTLREHYIRASAQNVLETRIRLGELTTWPGSAVQEAICVATAIELVMNALYDGKKDLMTWCMHALEGESIQFKIERLNGKWRSNLAEIDSALSLWLFSVREREYQDSTVDNKDPGAWLRTGLAVKKKALRLLGPITPASRRDLKWWLTCGSDQVLDVWGPLPPDETLPEPDDLGPSGVTIEAHRVVGPAGWSTQEKPAQDTGYVSWVFHNQDKPAPKDIFAGAFAITSDSPLAQLYSQDMFSAFLWAVAPELKSIVGSKTPGTGDAHWNSFTLENGQLSRLAEDIRNTGLGSLEDVYMTLVPPLSHHAKLNSSVIEDLAIEQARKHELERQWEEAVKCLFWALPFSLKFSFNATPGAKAIGALLELQCRLADAVRLQEMLTPTFTESEHDETPREKHSEITQLLKSLVHGSTLRKIAALYNFQGRPPQTHPEFEDWWPEDYQQMPGTPKTWSLGVTELHEMVVSRKSNWIPQSLYRDDLTVADSLGWTAVHYAVMAENWAAVEDMKRCSPIPLAADLAGCTPIHYHLSSKQTKIPESPVSEYTPETPPPKEGSDTAIFANYLLDQRLLDAAQLRSKSHGGLTILHHARGQVRTGLFERLVKEYIRTGVGVDIQDNRGMTTLHWAVLEGRARSVRVLLSRGHASPHIRQENHLTPLHCAVLCDDNTSSVEIVKLLVTFGADKDATDGSGRTVLHMAVDRKRKTLVVALLDEGASLKKEDLNGDSPLHVATKRGPDDEILHLLLERQYREKYNDPPPTDDLSLHLAIRCGNWDIVRALVRQGVNPHDTSKNGTTLHKLVSEYTFEPSALGEKFDVNATDTSGDTFLHCAVRSTRVRNMDRLVRAGINLMKCDPRGKTGYEVKGAQHRTALHMAVDKGNVRLVTAFLNAGANLKERDSNGDSPVDIAAKRGQDDKILLSLLRKQYKDLYGSPPSDDDWSLHLAVRCKNWKVVQALIQLGADPYELSKNGTKLPDLIPDNDIWRWILQEQFKEQNNKPPPVNDLSLHLGIRCNNWDIVGKLITMDTDPHMPSKNGTTLHDLVFKYDFRPWYLGKKFDPLAKDAKGNTLLHSAVESGKITNVEAMLQTGVNRDAQNNDGKTAMDLANSKGDTGIIALIEGTQGPALPPSI